MSTSDTTDLFHYTGTTGIKGILETRTLWATDSCFLNDTSEGTIPETILRRLSHMTISSGVHSDLAHEWIQKKIETIPKSRSFVTCFCRQPDLLSQWRGYSSGLTGYALGFNRDTLEQHIVSESVRIKDCIYIKDKNYREIEASFSQQLEAVKETFAKHELPPKEDCVFSESMRWLEGPNDKQKVECEALLDGFWDSMVEKIISNRPFLKPDAFREESETRFVVSAEAHSAILYRDNSNNLIPYLELGISKVIENGGLSCIVVGPSSNHRRAIQGLEKFLEDKGISGVRIYSTAATFSRH